MAAPFSFFWEAGIFTEDSRLKSPQSFLKERVMKRPSTAEKRPTPRPERVKLSREEVLRRMRTIPEWREKTLAEFKRRYPDAFKDQA